MSEQMTWGPLNFDLVVSERLPDGVLALFYSPPQDGDPSLRPLSERTAIIRSDVATLTLP